MRVYELARALGIPSSDVIAQLRGDGEWVDSHLSAIPEPVADRYLPERPAPDQPRPPELPALERLPSYARPWLPPAEPRPARRPQFKRRPGPRTFTMQRPAGDEYDDPIDDLRYEPEITTRDVAHLLDVTQATVRRWVARGYIGPVGKLVRPISSTPARSSPLSTASRPGARRPVWPAARTATAWSCPPSTTSGRSTTTQLSMLVAPPV